MIDLSDGWDEYWKSRPECLRAACRNQEDRWGVASGVRHVTHRFGACEPLHSPKLQRLLKRIAGLDHVGRDRVGTLCSDMPSERLDHALLASLPQVVGDAVTVKMELEVHGLEVAGQLQAAALNIRVADLWHNVGVVAADRATLPVFMRSMLEHRARRGDGSLRMCLSSGCGLEAWYTQSLKSHRIQCYHWSARSQLLNWNRKLHSWFHGRRRGGAQAGDGGGDRRPQLGAAGPGSGPSSVALDRRVERLPPRLQPHLRIYRGREFVED